MKSFIFAAIISLLSMTQAIKIDIPQYVCSFMVNGTKIRDNSPTCKEKYYECIDGHAIEANCNKKYTLDKDRQICVLAADYKCPTSNTCVGKKNGFDSDPYSCDGYYSCPKGTRGECANHMSFYDNLCWEDDRCDIDFCLMVPSYKYFGVGDESQCSEWRMCKGEKLEYGFCDSGMIFDRDDGTCDYEHSGNCRPSQDHLQTKVGSYCNGETFKFEIVPNSCTSYFYCHNSKVEVGQCAQGKFFTDGNTCTDRLNYACTRSDNPCEGLENSTHSKWQWVNDPKDCRKYYHCSNGKVNGGANKCPDSSPFFNAEKQVCSVNPPDYNACVIVKD